MYETYLPQVRAKQKCRQLKRQQKCVKCHRMRKQLINSNEITQTWLHVWGLILKKAGSLITKSYRVKKRLFKNYKSWPKKQTKYTSQRIWIEKGKQLLGTFKKSLVVNQKNTNALFLTKLLKMPFSKRLKHRVS